MQPEPISTFEDLDVWKNCREVRRLAAVIAREFPSAEKYRLRDQLLRSARSITANIAEGYGRYHYQENLQFCRQARGSLYETLDHLITAHDESLISSEVLAEFRNLFEQAVAVLNGYINYLARRASEVRPRPRVKKQTEAYDASGLSAPTG